MSLAGVDPTESNGIPGNATNVRQLETVVERVESPQEKRQEIAHTNIRMGLDVLFRQFIYIGTYTWKTSDAPGKVIATFPIHPSACNEYTDHTYQMFNTWVGGQKARIRIIGTAFYGGGLFFVRVPPNFTQAQIDSMSLSGFTAFPHSDMDPKNLSSIDMDLQDYRAGHFHSGDLDLSDPNSFAGYLVIVVNARLVTQSADIQQLDLRVEMAGNYQFQVPRPIRQKQAEVSGPLSDASTTLTNLFGCDDVICNPYLNHLVSLAKTVTSYTQGSVFHRALGGDWFYTKANTSTVGTADLSQWWTDAENARKSKDDGTFSGYGNFTIRTANDTLYVNAPSHEPAPAPLWNQCNYLPGVWYTSDNKPTQAFQIEDFNFTQNTFTIGGGGQGGGTANEGTIYADAVASGFAGAIDTASTFYKANDSDPNVPDESLVILVTNNGASVSTQAKQWGDDLKTFSGWPAGDAALYELYNIKSGVIVSYLKLRKNGFMYSNPVTADVSFGLNCKLRFSQWIPENEPIPPAPKFTNLALNAAIDKAVQKAEAKILRKSAHHERSR